MRLALFVAFWPRNLSGAAKESYHTFPCGRMDNKVCAREDTGETWLNDMPVWHGCVLWESTSVHQSAQGLGSQDVYIYTYVRFNISVIVCSIYESLFSSASQKNREDCMPALFDDNTGISLSSSSASRSLGETQWYCQRDSARWFRLTERFFKCWYANWLKQTWWYMAKLAGLIFEI